MRISDWSSDVCSSDLSRHLAKAVDAGNQAEAILAREDAERRVNAGYIIEAEMTEDGPIPRHIKDRIRASGPTVRADLGINNSIPIVRSEEHTSELQSLMRISYAVFCLKKKTKQQRTDAI